MKRKAAAAAAVVAMLIGSSARAADKTMDQFRNEKIGNWTLMVTAAPERCAASIDYADGSFMIVAYDGAIPASSITLYDPKFKSITANQMLTLEVDFFKDKKQTFSQKDTKALGVVSSSMKGFMVLYDSPEILATIEANDSLSFLNGTVLVDDLPLGSAAGMIAELRRCSTAAYQDRADDPFKK